MAAAAFSPDGRYIACAVGRLLQVLSRPPGSQELHRIFNGVTSGSKGVTQQVICLAGVRQTMGATLPALWAACFRYSQGLQAHKSFESHRRFTSRSKGVTHQVTCLVGVRRKDSLQHRPSSKMNDLSGQVQESLKLTPGLYVCFCDSGTRLSATCLCSGCCKAVPGRTPSASRPHGSYSLRAQWVLHALWGVCCRSHKL